VIGISFEQLTLQILQTARNESKHTSVDAPA